MWRNLFIESIAGIQYCFIFGLRSFVVEPWDSIQNKFWEREKVDFKKERGGEFWFILFWFHVVDKWQPKAICHACLFSAQSDPEREFLLQSSCSLTLSLKIPLTSLGRSLYESKFWLHLGPVFLMDLTPRLFGAPPWCAFPNTQQLGPLDLFIYFS